MLALPAFAEEKAESEAQSTIIDGEFFTCEIPNAKDWKIRDGKGKTKHLVSLKYELSTTVTILDRQEGEDLNSAAEKLAGKLDATIMKTDPELESDGAAARKSLDEARAAETAASEPEKKAAARITVKENEKKVLDIVKDREMLKRKADDEKTIWEYRTLVDSQTVYGQLFVSDAGLTHISVIGNEHSTDVLSMFRTLEVNYPPPVEAGASRFNDRCLLGQVLHNLREREFGRFPPYDFFVYTVTAEIFFFAAQILRYMRSPSVSIFFAALMSRSYTVPHLGQMTILTDRSFVIGFLYPHTWHG